MSAARGPRKGPGLRLVVGLALAWLGSAGAARLDGMWSLPGSMTDISRRYSHEQAVETEEVLLEEGPDSKCVANVPNVVGVLPSSCCGEMRCPKSDGVCCTGNSHCCAAGHICIQGDPGTPPGCLDVLNKRIPVAVHKLLRKHHMDVKLVTPPKPKAAVPGYRPGGRLNYEDALAPRHRNVLAQHRIAETTQYHRNQQGDVKAAPERERFTLPNLPGFPTVPESAVSNAEVDPATLTKEELAEKRAVADGKREWVAPDAVSGSGGGVRDGAGNPVGQLRAYGNDAVVMLPGEGRRGDLPKPDLNKAQAEHEATGGTGTVASVSIVHAPTTLATTAAAPSFREVSASVSPRGARAPTREEDEGAAALARLFPPDPESATRDPPSPPTEEDRTLARIAAQLEKVNRMRGELRAELRGMQGVDGLAIPGV